MRLRYADLRNLCQHRRTCVQFAPGLNFIVGPNGVGKSNLLNMICGVVSGNFKRNDGNKDANICQLAGKDEPSYGEVMMEHLGRDIQIHHGLRGSGVWLVDPIENPSTINGATNVVAHMTRILGVSPKLLDEHVFVGQGDVASFFSALDSERAILCNRLFGLENADKVYGVVNKHIASLMIPTVGTLKDQLTKRIEELTTRQRALVEKLGELARIIPMDYDYRNDPLHQKVLAYSCICTLTSELTRLEADYAHLKVDVDEMRPKHQALTDDLVFMTNFLAKEAGKREQARRDVIAWGNYKNIQAQLEKLTQAEQDLASMKAKNPEPVKPAEYIAVNDEPWNTAWWTRYDELKELIETANRHIEAAYSGKPCPHCGTAAPQLAASLGDHKRALDTYTEEFDGMNKRVDLSHAYDNELYRWQCQVDRWKNQEIANLADRKRLEATKKPEKSLEELNTYLSDMLHMERAKDITSAQLAGFNFNMLVGRLDAYTRNLSVKREELSHYESVSKEEAEQAQADLNTRLNAMTVRAATQQDLAAVDENLASTQKQLNEVTAMETEAAVTVLWQKQSEEMKSLVHATGAPKLSAESNLRILQEDVNDLLLRFDAPYRVSASGNLSFVAHFFRGEKAGIRQPASRLSGGEEILLALAFRIAVHGRFAGELGLLCMDEPTSFLDKKNLASVMTGFERLRELCRNTGLQVVLITHDERLLPLADNVIDLGAMKENGDG